MFLQPSNAIVFVPIDAMRVVLSQVNASTMCDIGAFRFVFIILDFCMDETFMDCMK